MKKIASILFAGAVTLVGIGIAVFGIGDIAGELKAKETAVDETVNNEVAE